MKFLYVAALLCLSGFVSAEDDGSWKGEGLAESQDWGQYNGYYPYYSPYYRGYWGNWAAAPLADTPEVAAAKAAHFAAYNAAAAKSGAYPYAAYPYWGYWGSAPLAADGRVVDTPEVALAKSAHFAAHAAAATGVAAGAVAPVETPEVMAAKSAHFAAYNEAAARSGAYPYAYWGYYGSPVELTADGKYLKDTPEVAAAKARHFAAVAAAH